MLDRYTSGWNIISNCRANNKIEEDELPLGEVTGLGAFRGSVGAAGLTADFSGEGADGVDKTKQCRGLLEQLLDQEQMQVQEG